MTLALDPYQNTIFKRTYARWVEAESRREHYPEAVDRYLEFFRGYNADRYDYNPTDHEISVAREGLLDLEVMPSMRAFMTAGAALDQVAMANYNCTAHGMDTVKAFSDLMYIMMCGAGSGFSVEKQFTKQLPTVARMVHKDGSAIVVDDSRVGWCEALHAYLIRAYEGRLSEFDISGVREEGARLKTFGGYASGGKVLLNLADHIDQIFLNAAGRQLRPIEVFSIATMIAQIVVVGGVRRSATICLFDLDDEEMLRSKTGDWAAKGSGRQHYAMANISAVFEETPTRAQFDRYWKALKDSFAGEPGIFNRAGIWKHLKAHGRKIHYPDGTLIPFLANPCCEIVLRPKQACNLTGVAVRPGDSLVSLERKTEIAAMLGTWQSGVNHFEYLDQEWHDNINEERLLGVCLSGFYDHEILGEESPQSGFMLRHLRETAINANSRHAAKLGIPASASVTSVKPAGNSGELYNTASGIHPRYAEYYLRNIRVSRSDPIAAFLTEQGVPVEESSQNERDLVFSFPRKSPDRAVIVDDISAVKQLGHWKHVKENFTTHTVSATIYIRENEWDAAADWVHGNFDEITGIAFLPFDNGSYHQAPMQRITKEEYEAAVAAFPAELDWEGMVRHEQVDTTSPSQEFVCIGDKCMLTA